MPKEPMSTFVAGGKEFEVVDKGAREASNVSIGQVMLCVSTYRGGIQDNSNDYYYALSYDGGKSFTEIKDSKGFGGGLGISTDVQCIEYDGGLLMLATYPNASRNVDFKAVYTRDFITYYSSEVDIGFIRLSKTFIDSSAYVWTPNLFKLGNKYYIACSVAYKTTETGDVYFATDTRYLRVYCTEVEIDVSNGLDIRSVGNIFQIQYANDTESTMDASFVEYDGKVYSIYKDRIYNIVNIASADTINDTFQDIIPYCGKMAFNEAGYILKVTNNLVAYWANYSHNYNQKATVDVYGNTLRDVEYIGCTNSSHAGAYNLDPGMRNPYPMIITSELFNAFKKVYTVTDTFSSYTPKKRNTLKNEAVLSVISKVIYDKFGYYTHYPEEYVLPNDSIRDGFDAVYFDNQPTVIRLANQSSFTINDEKGSFFVQRNNGVIRAVMFEGMGAIFSSSYIRCKTFDIGRGITLKITQNAGIRVYSFFGTLTEQLNSATTMYTITDTNIPAPFDTSSCFVTAANGSVVGTFNVDTRNNINYYGNAALPSGTIIRYQITALC